MVIAGRLVIRVRRTAGGFRGGTASGRPGSEDHRPRIAAGDR